MEWFRLVDIPPTMAADLKYRIPWCCRYVRKKSNLSNLAHFFLKPLRFLSM